MNCVVEFDLQKAGFQFWSIGISGGIAALAGILVYINEKKKWLPLPFPFLRAGGLVFAIVCAFVTIFELIPAYSDYRTVLKLYKDGKFAIAEGVVHDFSPYDPAWRHSTESFEIGDKRFSLFPNTKQAGYLMTTSSQHDPLKEGVMARIFYIDNRIIRLEVCPAL